MKTQDLIYMQVEKYNSFVENCMHPEAPTEGAVRGLRLSRLVANFSTLSKQSAGNGSLVQIFSTANEA